MAIKNVTMADIQAAIASRRNYRPEPIPGWSQRVQSLIRNAANEDYAVHSGSERAQSGGLSDAPDDGGPKVQNGGMKPYKLMK